MTHPQPYTSPDASSGTALKGESVGSRFLTTLVWTLNTALWARILDSFIGPWWTLAVMLAFGLIAAPLIVSLCAKRHGETR